MPASGQEKAIALEWIGANTIIVLDGVINRQAFPGPTYFVGAMIAYGLLGALAYVRWVGNVPEILGGILLLAMLMRQTTDASGNTTSLGGEIFPKLAEVGQYRGPDAVGVQSA